MYVATVLLAVFYFIKSYSIVYKNHMLPLQSYFELHMLSTIQLFFQKYILMMFW
jgi:hypothetical protein